VNFGATSHSTDTGDVPVRQDLTCSVSLFLPSNTSLLSPVFFFLVMVNVFNCTSPVMFLKHITRFVISRSCGSSTSTPWATINGQKDYLGLYL